jgi:hypothetical protein
MSFLLTGSLWFCSMEHFLELLHKKLCKWFSFKILSNRAKPFCAHDLWKEKVVRGCRQFCQLIEAMKYWLNFQPYLAFSFRVHKLEQNLHTHHVTSTHVHFRDPTSTKTVFGGTKLKFWMNLAIALLPIKKIELLRRSNFTNALFRGCTKCTRGLSDSFCCCNLIKFDLKKKVYLLKNSCSGIESQIVLFSTTV